MNATTPSLLALCVLLGGCASDHLIRDAAAENQTAVARLDAEKAQPAQAALLAAISGTAATPDTASRLIEAEKIYTELASDKTLPTEERGDARYNLALVRLALADTDGALLQSERALELNPGAAHAVALHQRLLRLRIENLQAQLNASLKSTLAAQAELIRAQGVQVATEVANQNAILDRTVGKYLPVKLPPEMESRLASLEAIADNPASWPANASTLDAHAAEINRLVARIPAYAEQELLPRVAAIRWHARTYAALTPTAPATAAALAESLEHARQLRSATPGLAGQKVLAGLDRRIAELETAYPATLVAELSADASRAIASPDTADQSDCLTAVDNALETPALSPAQKNTLSSLRSQLASRLGQTRTDSLVAQFRSGMDLIKADASAKTAEARWSQLIAQLTAQLTAMKVDKAPPSEIAKIESLLAQATRDATTWQSNTFIGQTRTRLDRLAGDLAALPNQASLKKRQADLQLIASQAAALAFTLKSEDHATPELSARVDALLADVETAKSSLQDAKFNAYQAWALSEIHAFHAAKEQATRLKKWNNDDPYRRELANLLVKYLVPIDAALLHPSVQRIYQDKWTQSYTEMEKLSGELFEKIAKETLSIKRKGLDDV